MDIFLNGEDYRFLVLVPVLYHAKGYCSGLALTAFGIMELLLVYLLGRVIKESEKSVNSSAPTWSWADTEAFRDCVFPLHKRLLRSMI